MASSPVFVGTPKNGLYNDVAATPVAIFTAGSSGARVDRILFKKTASTTTATLTFSLYNSATDYQFEVVTSEDSTSYFGESSVVSPTKPLFLAANVAIYAVSSNGGDTFDTVVIGGDL